MTRLTQTEPEARLHCIYIVYPQREARSWDYIVILSGTGCQCEWSGRQMTDAVEKVARDYRRIMIASA